MAGLLVRFWFDECGTTALEYAVIATSIAVVLVASLTSIGTKLGTNFNVIDTKLP